jgi:hypothetical protein
VILNQVVIRLINRRFLWDLCREPPAASRSRSQACVTPHQYLENSTCLLTYARRDQEAAEDLVALCSAIDRVGQEEAERKEELEAQCRQPGAAVEGWQTGGADDCRAGDWGPAGKAR